MRDEGEYAYSAQLLINGVAPYQHSFIQKPPMVIYSYAVADLLAPHVYYGPRLLADLFVAAATLLLGYAAALEFGVGVAFCTMCLATPMVLLPTLDQYPANTEMFMLLPLMATVALFLHGRKHGHAGKFLVAAGMLGMVTFLYKYTSLPLVGFVYLCWLFEIARLRNGDRFWRSLGLLAFGSILASVIVLGWFLWRDGGAHLWECTIQFNRYYLGSKNFALTNLWQNVAGFWSSWWILFFLAPAALLMRGTRVWFWVGLFILAWFSTGNSAYGQYYVLIMPFWALLAAVGIRALGFRLGEWQGRPSRWFGSLAGVIVLILILRVDVPWMTCSPERFAVAKLSGYPFLESQLVARKVAELTSSGDPVYIAGSEPQILYYAGRFSPTRFITAYAMMIPTPVAQQYQQEAIADLLKNPPAVVVFVGNGTSWLRQEKTPGLFLDFLGRFLSEGYQRVGGYVPGEKTGEWDAPLSDDEMAKASLVLYQRKK